MAGFSSVAGSINVLVTCAAVRRSRGSTKSTANLFCAGMLITSMLLLFVVPVLAAGLAMLLSDRNLNSIYFDVAGGGDALLYQHLFWFFGHPEVYILIIPSFSIVSQCLQEEGAFSLFNRLGMVFAVGSISFVGFFVWAHHMFAVGLDIDSRTYYSSITMAIGLPTAIKVFSWLVCTIRTLVGSSVLIVILGFVTCIVAGGVTGLMLANSEIDLVLHDSYFVVGHFHLVLALAAVFGVIVGLLYGFRHWSGRSICDLFMGRFVLPGFVLGAGTIFWQFHLCGLLGCPRRVSDCADGFVSYNSSSSLGVVLTIWSLLAFLLSLLEVSSSSGSVCKRSPNVGGNIVSPAVLSIGNLAVNSSGGEASLPDYAISHTFSVSLAQSVVWLISLTTG